MRKAELGVGIAGAGFIGPVHIEALRRNNVRVVGLSGSSKQDAELSANELGIGKAYESYEDMVGDPNISVVHLATPNYLHYSQTKAALLAGKHVICEKPLAMNSQQSAELIKIARETNRVAVVNFNLRFYPLVQQAREIIRSGKIGDLYVIHGSYLQDWLLFPTDWNWRLDPNLGGTLRAVADIGSHWLDMVSFITGLQVESVLADFKTILPVRKKPARSVQTFTGEALDESQYIEQSIATEDYATILIHFTGGVRGVVTVSQVSAGRKNRLFFEVDGSQSAVAWNSEEPNQLWIGHRNQPNEVLLKDPALLSPDVREFASYPGGHNEGFPDTFKQLYRRVYAYIRAGDYDAPADFPTFEDGHYELVVGEAIERSAKEKAWIDIKG